MINIKRALSSLRKIDNELTPYFKDIQMHLERYNDKLNKLTDGSSDLVNSINGHLYFGFHKTNTEWVYREWLPGADGAWLTGDFNNWNTYEYPLTNIGEGIWEIKIGLDTLKHGQYVKLIVGRLGSSF